MAMLRLRRRAARRRRRLARRAWRTRSTVGRPWRWTARLLLLEALDDVHDRADHLRDVAEAGHEAAGTSRSTTAAVGWRSRRSAGVSGCFGSSAGAAVDTAQDHRIDRNKRSTHLLPDNSIDHASPSA